MGRRKINKKEKIIRYILKNRYASVKQIAEATGSSTKYVYNLKAQSGTPKEVIEKELNVQPVVTETFKDYSGTSIIPMRWRANQPRTGCAQQSCKKQGALCLVKEKKNMVTSTATRI